MAIIGIDLGTSHSACADQLKEALQEVGKKLYEQAATKVPPARPNVGGPTGRVASEQLRATRAGSGPRVQGRAVVLARRLPYAHQRPA
jgi:hypothetical protein